MKLIVGEGQLSRSDSNHQFQGQGLKAYSENEMFHFQGQ